MCNYTWEKNSESDNGDNFVRNVTFVGNVFSVPAGAEEVLFQWHGEVLEGISAFDSKTGGNNVFEKGNDDIGIHEER